MNELQILKSDINQCRIVKTDFDTDSPLAEGELLLKIDKFGFSANNVTYAAAGDQLGYWQFFPAADNEEGSWGIIPVWGFADVIASGTEGVAVGERIFGYFPTSNYLKMQNVKAFDTRLVDGAEHRAQLPPGYNTYRRVDKEAAYDKSMDNLRMLLWPLYITSFCLWDSLQDKDWHGVKQVLVISASSKTSLGLGYALAADDRAPASIGLTSQRNQDWVKSLDLYDQTINYDSLNEIDNTLPTAIVDMSGNSKLLRDINDHLGDQLVHCLNVGLTHWSASGEDSGIAKDRREFFFAPSHIQMRIKQWGPEGFDAKSSQFIAESSKKSAQWMALENLENVEKLAAIYPDVCSGKLPPEKALVIELR